MKTVLSLCLLFTLWILLSFVIGDYFVPYPWVTVVDFFDLFVAHDGLYHLCVTLLRVFLGFVIAVLIGFMSGWFLGKSDLFSALSRPLVLFFQGMPPILWTIPLILIAGVGFFTPVIVIALITFPLIVVNISEGVKTIPKPLEEMVTLFAPGFFPKIREVDIPHLKPFITAALELGIVLALKASTVAEFFGATDGIGAQINGAYQAFRMRDLFAWGFMVIVLILLFHGLSAWRKKGGGISRKSDQTIYCKSQKARKVDDVFYQGVEVRGLSFGYQPKLPILKDVNITLKNREILVLAGDSGKGKTTLIHLLAGFLKADQGSIKISRRIGVIFQDDRLLPWRNVLYNAALPVIYGASGGTDPKPMVRVLNWLKRCGLEECYDHLPSELSGGMKKRLSLARCLSLNPDVLLLDEPFVGLDKKARMDVWKILKGYYDKNNIIIFIVTHHPEEIPFLSECRIMQLKDHRIYEKQKPAFSAG